MHTIGLTGGIATGKSTVSQYLIHQAKLPLLDADCFARDAVSPHSEGLRALAHRYGTKLLQKDGTLDRAQLAQIIFQDAAERSWVESLLHPYVRQRLAEGQRLAQAQKTAILVMDIPLLFEAQMTDLASEVWVVSCSSEQQLARLISRNHLTQAEGQARIESQMPLAQKCCLADVVLDNSGSLEMLFRQVDQVLQRLTNFRASFRARFRG